jgi:hypothetical protein
MKKYYIFLLVVATCVSFITCAYKIGNTQDMYYGNVSNSYVCGTYYDPNIYAPPFWPGYEFSQWYAQPGYVVFIGYDGRHQRHRYDGMYCGNGYNGYFYGTHYDPNIYAPPFWPGYAFSRWYARPGYVYFIGHDGQHHRYHYDRWQHPPQNQTRHWQQRPQNWQNQNQHWRQQQQRPQQQWRQQQQRPQQQLRQQQQRPQQQLRQQQQRPQQQLRQQRRPQQRQDKQKNQR